MMSTSTNFSHKIAEQKSGFCHSAKLFKPLDIVTRKLYLESGQAYPFEDYFTQGHGNAMGELGLIFHGSDAEYNRLHTPVKELLNDEWLQRNDHIQVVTEKQRMGIEATKREEKHIVRRISGNSNLMKFALRWDNSNGQYKDTPMSTFGEIQANSGKRIKSLIEGQCQTFGNMQIVAEDDCENGCSWGTREESYCGEMSAWYNWRRIFETGYYGFVDQHVDNVQHFCFAHFGKLHQNAHLKINVGWMRKDSDETFGTIMDNLSWTWLQWSAIDLIGSASETDWVHMCIDIRARVVKLRILSYPES